LKGWGTGFAIGEKGKKVEYIVTNAHVVFDMTTGEPYDVSICYSNAENDFVTPTIYTKNFDKDIAILKLPTPTNKRKPLVLKPIHDKKVNITETFVALGFPGAAMTLEDLKKLNKDVISTSVGTISRTVRENEVRYLQTNVDISEGFSGGPLVNSKGEVVGINSAYTLSQASSNGAIVKVNYAVAIEELIAMINRDEIPYTLSGEITTLTLIYIGCGVLVVGLITLFLIILFRKKKMNNAIPAANVGQNYVPFTSKQNITPSKTAYVRGISGRFAGKTFQISDRILFGRDNNKCSIAFPLDAPGISGTHCELSFDGSNIYLRDLGSSYGTFLSDNTKIPPNQTIRLDDGSTFYLAEVENSFEVKIG